LSDELKQQAASSEEHWHSVLRGLQNRHVTELETLEMKHKLDIRAVEASARTEGQFGL